MIVEYCLNINAPIDDVYKASQDYSVRYLWDPFPEKIEILSGETEPTLGTKVLVIAKSGLKMEVQFIQIKPPTTAAVVMIKGPFFLQTFAGSWIFRGEGNASTYAKFRYSIKVKLWALPLLSDRLASYYFKKTVISRMSGLKRYCENRVSKGLV